MFSRFFIDRPIFATVLSIVIVIAGVVAALTLPLAQYPEIAPPTVQVSCLYPGASAKVVMETVAAPIEQQVNGVENMLYMQSQCTNDGAYNLTVTFKLGTNLDMAQVLVQNRVSMAMPTLPEEVKTTGVTTKKKSPNIMQVVSLISPDGRYDPLYISNYFTIQVKDELARIDGVGDVTLFGAQDYSMRIWIDPNLLASRDMTSNDVVAALKEQNVQVAAGQIGQPPIPAGQDFQYVLSTVGRLTTPEQFERIIVKTGASGEVTHLRDVARIELGPKSQDVLCTLDTRPSQHAGVFQLPGSNAVETAHRVRAKMEELKQRFPPGLDYKIVYDTTPFIEESVHEVFKALRDAFILVAIVVLVFLQNWRSTLIPLIAVPVSLIGTFAVMTVFGFTLNNLSLFGLVLAIGIVVDDAIVVVENVERWMAQGLSPKEAAYKSMEEVTVAVIAIAFGLSAVFIPTAFISGITGQFYRQFALTIATSTLISAFNSLTLSPALAAILLKPHTQGAHGHARAEALPRLGIVLLLGLAAFMKLTPHVASLLGLPPAGPGAEQEHVAAGGEAMMWVARAIAFLVGAVAGWFLSGPINRLLGGFFAGFNWAFNRITEGYGRSVRLCIRMAVVPLLVFAGLLGATYYGLLVVPSGFIPSQDKGYLMMTAQLPDSASQERTKAVMDRLEQIAIADPGVAHTIGISGYSMLLSANGSNFGSMFVVLKGFEERHGPQLSADAVAARLRRQFRDQIQEAMVAVFGAPPVDGLGTAGGFKFFIQDRGDMGLEALQGQTENLVENANRQPGLVGVFSQFRASTPQLFIDVDRTKCKTLGVSLSDVFSTLQASMGSRYVNDFNRFGRTWQVNVQADAGFRTRPEEVTRLKVRNAQGNMVPLGTVVNVKETSGPVLINRYNMYPAAAVNGAAAPGFSSGQAIAAIGQLASSELPASMSFEWTELTFMQILAGNTAVFIFPLCVLFVFLTHSAEYESWLLPLAIILIAPLSIPFALAGISIAGLENNLFTQIGFVVLIGLACKNAVLIVEFAKQRHEHGMGHFEAAVEASRLRLRPIMMTSFAFILGVVPLMLGTGAGAEMRRTMGTTVFSGMLGVTFLGIFLTPVFYYVLQWLAGRTKTRTTQTTAGEH